MKKFICLFCSLISLGCVSLTSNAQSTGGLGQTIQINTRLHSFVGTPSWTLIIRDVDHGQNIPYVFDFNKGTNFWIAMTYGTNYLITASTLQFSPYRHYPDYRTLRVENFCNLESHGRIVRGESMSITITGQLSPYTDRYDCHVMVYPDNGFDIAQPSM